MRRGAEEFDERFTAFVRSRGEHHLRMATLLTGNPDAAEDLVQASLLKLYRAWSRIDTSGEPDAYLRRIIVNTHRSWWRARWRREAPVPEVPEAPAAEDVAERHAVGTLVRALFALLKSGAKVLDEGSVSGPGWTGTRYRFTVPHPEGTAGIVDRITCTVDVDSQGHIRSLAQTTVFVASGKPGTAGEMIYTTDFTFSDFGIRFSVTPPPASQIAHDIGVAIQF